MVASPSIPSFLWLGRPRIARIRCASKVATAPLIPIAIPEAWSPPASRELSASDGGGSPGHDGRLALDCCRGSRSPARAQSRHGLAVCRGARVASTAQERGVPLAPAHCRRPHPVNSGRHRAALPRRIPGGAQVGGRCYGDAADRLGPLSLVLRPPPPR